MSKVRQVVALVLGSVCVHVIVSCASSAIHSASTQDAGTSDVGSILDAFVDTGNADTATKDGASFLDALTDVLNAADSVSTPDANADPATSGTRLHAVYQVTTSDDGATNKYFTAWHDSTLNVDCTFVLYADGSTRCVPTTSVATAVGYFADAGCTLPLTFATTCSTATFIQNVSLTTATSCVAGTYTYQLWHAKTTSAPTTYYSGSGTTCTQVTTPWPYSGSTYTTFVATAVVAPSELQNGTITRLVE